MSAKHIKSQLIGPPGANAAEWGSRQCNARIPVKLAELFQCYRRLTEPTKGLGPVVREWIRANPGLKF